MPFLRNFINIVMTTIINMASYVNRKKAAKKAAKKASPKKAVSRKAAKKGTSRRSASNGAIPRASSSAFKAKGHANKILQGLDEAEQIRQGNKASISFDDFLEEL